jgi:hypothetical protein
MYPTLPEHRHSLQIEAMQNDAKTSSLLSMQPAPAYLCPENTIKGTGAEPDFLFSFLAHRRPQALQSVLGPLGPLRHSGESSVPG